MDEAAISDAALLAQLEEMNTQLSEDSRSVVTVEMHVEADRRPDVTEPEPESDHEMESTQRFGSHSGLSSEAMAHWSSVLKTWELNVAKRPAVLSRLVQNGVPPMLRGLVWQHLAAGYPQVNNWVVLSGEPDPTYAELLAMDSSDEKQMAKDIARTYPEHEFFKKAGGEGQQVLLNLIKAYACFDREVGYCQGAAFIAGMLLMHMPEEDAFNLFKLLMRQFNIRGLFRPSMADLPLRVFQFKALFNSHYPELCNHFEDMMIPLDSFVTSWFLTLFGGTLPIECVCRIWDVFFLDPGPPGGSHGILDIFRAGLAILGLAHERLLRSNFEGILGLLSRIQLEESFRGRSDELMAAVGKLNASVTPKQLQLSEKAYLAAKEAEAASNSELQALRRTHEAVLSEITTLQAKVSELESENQAMARRLAEKSVALIQAEEKISELEMINGAVPLADSLSKTRT